MSELMSNLARTLRQSIGELNPEWTPQARAQAAQAFEGLIPVWGSGKEAVQAAQQGKPAEAAFNALLAGADAATLGGGSLAKPLLAMSVSKPEGVTKIAQMLTELFRGKSAEVIGTVEPNHMARWGKADQSDSLLFGVEDVAHTTKRLNEGLTPEEVAEIGYRATQKNAHAQVTGKNDLLLTSPVPMKFDDSPLFKPQALLREGGDGLHLYGVIPRGWKWRKK